jgi:hypothetical protein
MPNIVATFLELGEATSHNLEFAHRRNVSVSYGEEAITENNLLEIRRRHPRLVHLETFPKWREARCGADWEWHIIGQKYTLRMRVQAKRVQRNGNLKIKHRVKFSGQQQRDLLLTSANADKMKPVYCFYCTESQRVIWKKSIPTEDLGEFQTGCLLADANRVPEVTTKLKQVEKVCVPWHYLFMRADFARYECEGVEVTYPLPQYLLNSSIPDRSLNMAWHTPSIEDLNGQGYDNFDPTGVHETNPEEAGDMERLHLETESGNWSEQASIWLNPETSVRWIMLIDVRNLQRR